MISTSKCERWPLRRSGAAGHALVLPLMILAALMASPRVLAATARCEAHAARDHETLPAWKLADWEPLDDRTVLIWTKHSARASLVRLARPLAGLATASIISLVDGDGDRTISPCGSDALTLGYGESDAVRIVSIELLSERRTAALDAGEELARLVLSRI